MDYLWAVAIESAPSSSSALIALYVGIDSVCLWEEMKSGYSNGATLPFPQSENAFSCTCPLEWEMAYDIDLVHLWARLIFYQFKTNVAIMQTFN